MAGVSRLQYSPDLKVIRVMCTGRVDLSFILRAFSNGSDGVFIGGCWPGECHYITEGNYDALNMTHLCKKILEHLKMNSERLRLEWISASEGMRFAEVMNDFSSKIRGLGPLGQSEGVKGKALKSNLEAVIKLVPYIKMVKQEKLALRLDKEEAYKDLYTGDEVDRLFSDVISYYIDPEKCRACMICLRKCPVEAISGGKNRIHVIDQKICIKCGTCFEACPDRFGAVEKISGEPAPPPLPEEKRAVSRLREKPIH